MKFGDDHGLPMPKAVNSNMHITYIVESDSSRHLHSLVPRHSSGLRREFGMSLTFAEQSSFLVLM